MPEVSALHQRLADVATGLQRTGRGLALLGLGSVGRETDRLDRWSDLDFFAIVEPGTKAQFLEDPAWLAVGAPVDWRFRNTVDGFKLLWSDGIFGEMAVFEPAELAAIPFAPGRVVWSAPGFDPANLEPVSRAGQGPELPSLDHAAGELLSCLYVGLCRYHRGEKLSAWRFIQGYCLDRFLEIVELTTPAAPGHRDPYSRDRRFEQRYPAEAGLLPSLLAGYEHTPRVALVFLGWLEGRVPVNQDLASQVRSLAALT